MNFVNFKSRPSSKFYELQLTYEINDRNKIIILSHPFPAKYGAETGFIEHI